MCGICGIISTNNARPNRDDVIEMMRSIAHRGPDDSGLFCSDLAMLGHVRLSIIDLEFGQQPMATPDMRYVIVFNGEVYNYRQLRAQMESCGERFDTLSDTEVLLKWVVRYGVAGLKKLNGMFAFALWDSKERTLLFARDRLGIKPLYYSICHEKIVFASEIKAIHKVFPAKAESKAVFEFLCLQNVCGDKTFFEGVSRLLPGSWLKWSPNSVTTGKYWDIEFSNVAIDFADALNVYRDKLDGSVARHMISDVPVGAYLSGGFDSSTVATVASKYTEGPLHTFTGAFTDSEYYDERIGSRSVASSIGAILHEIEIDSGFFCDYLTNVVYHLDEPTVGTGALPQYVVSGLASRSVRVVLTGHGGDEMFCGYQVNKVAYLKESFRDGLFPALRALRSIRRDEISRFLYYFIYPLFYPEVGYGMFIMTPKRDRGQFFDPKFLAKISDYDPCNEYKRIFSECGETPSEKLTSLYLKSYLPNLLNQEDRMSMAHSIESRTPLCDNELLEFSLSLPLSVKMFGGNLKSITKAAMVNHLPKILYSLPKKGFPTPYARWFRREPIRSLVRDILLGERCVDRKIFNIRKIKKLLDENDRSGQDTLYDYARANRIWSTLVTEMWFLIFQDQCVDLSSVCHDSKFSSVFPNRIIENFST